MDKIRVILFDDNPNLRDSVSLLVAEQPDMHFIAAFEDCSGLQEAVQFTLPDVVMMDIDMPGINGIDAVKMIRINFPEVKVMMQTVFEDEEKVFAALRAGASGYILKNAEPQRIIAGIREVHMGASPLSPTIARMVLNQFQQMKPEQKEEFNLSPREKEVLALLVNGKSYKMISDELGITYDTVRAHMKKIYEKLHVSSMTEAVAKAINQKLFSVFI